MNSITLAFVGGFILTLSSQAGEFQDLSDSFATTRTLAGIQHATTTDPNGVSINFWTPASEGGQATQIGLSNPHMAVADGAGNIFIADKASHAILRLTTNGLIRTFAGTHTAGFNGDGPAPATSLNLDRPNGVFALPNGTVYLLDPGNHRIRRVDTNGVMTTIVNDPEPRWTPSGRALWVSPDEQLIYYTHEFSPIPPNKIADGAAVKKWTVANGIETICGRSVGFRNPGNIDVNPVDGKLYVCDRAEEDTTKTATGLFRIDGVGQRTRLTGNVTQPAAADGQSALNSFIEGPRGIAFRPDGSYFLAGHKDGNIWFVNTSGAIHKYLRGKGSGDGYVLNDGKHPPLTGKDYFAQPRSVTVAPNGDLLVICNDSGYLFQVSSGPPVIRSEPTAPIAHYGSNAMLFVTAVSVRPPNYQWLKNGSPLSGETNASLTLSNLSAPDHAQYAVVVSNPKGNVSSPSVTLAILPTITQQPQSIATSPGSTVAFSVTAAGVNALTYQWYKAPLVAIANATNSSFSITNVSAVDAGSYFVRITSAANGSVDSSNAALLLETRPVVTLQPTNVTAVLGQPMTFVVAGAGDAPLAYQWFFNAIALPGETHPTLRIAQVESADSGAYTATITNSFGAVTSSVAILTIRLPTNATKPVVTISSPAPVFTRTSSNVVTIAGTALASAGLDDVQIRNGADTITFLGVSNRLDWRGTLSLAPGTNFIQAIVKDLLDRSATNTRVVVYSTTNRLTLEIAPVNAGVVNGATNQQPLEVGKGYTLTAVPRPGFVFSNWTGDLMDTKPVLNFVMRSNMVLSANFISNPFAAWFGGYNGLYADPTDPRHERRGFFTTLVGSNGGFSGKIQNGLNSFPFTGQFDVEGNAVAIVKRPGTNTLTLQLALDLHGANTISGFVADSGWTAELLADRAVFSAAHPAPFTNKYTLLIPGGTDEETAPAGHGFGTATVDALGIIRFTGTLADGSPVVQTVPISEDGDWPLYLPLYGGKGSAFGWVEFRSLDGSDLDGPVNWFKPPRLSGKFYTNGFSSDALLIGSKYTPPGTNRLLNLDRTSIVFFDSELPEPLTNTIAFGPSGRITNIGPNKLTLTAVPGNGTWVGSVILPITKKVLTFKGAYLQKLSSGGGFHVGFDEPSAVELRP